MIAFLFATLLHLGHAQRNVMKADAPFDAAAIRRHTMQFSQQRFTVQIAEFVAAALTQSRSRAVARSGPSESRITNHESP